MSNEKKIAKATSKNVKSNEEIYTGFQLLRNEQRLMANKLSEMETELNEHK
jgi:prefoldin subunit 2